MHLCPGDITDHLVFRSDTWGLNGTLTYSAIAKYNNLSNGGGCYSIVSQDTINKGTSRAPSGFDWTQLVADISAFHS